MLSTSWFIQKILILTYYKTLKGKQSSIVQIQLQQYICWFLICENRLALFWCCSMKGLKAFPHYEYIQSTFQFFWANLSFFFSKRANEQFTQINERIGHLSWATWANSRLLFWHKRPDRFAHICSFVLSDVSKSLIVAHLIWAIWAHERMSYERMSELPTLGPLSWADNFFQQQNLDSAQMEVYKSWFYPRNIRS